MSEIDPRDFGRLETEVKQLCRSIETLSADMRAVRAALDAAGGGWRVLVAVGAIAGAASALAVKMLAIWPFR